MFNRLQKNKSWSFLTFILLLSSVLSSCSNFKESMIQQIQAQSQPMDIEVQVGDDHRYIDIDDSFCYTLVSDNEETTLGVYEGRALLFTKQWTGVINQHDHSKSVFLLEDSFFLALNRWEGTTSITDILKLSKTGTETKVISKSFYLDLDVWLYVDSYDDNFYISYNEKDGSLNNCFYDRYVFQDGALGFIESHVSADALGHGIKNILHTEEGEVVICSAIGPIFKRGGSENEIGQGSIFFGRNGHIYYYQCDWGPFADSYAIQLRDYTGQTTTDLIDFEHISGGLHSFIYSYQEYGVFLLYPNLGDYSKEESFIGIVIYDYFSETLYSYEMDVALVSVGSIACYGKRLYFTCETSGGAIVENLIDLSQLSN